MPELRKRSRARLLEIGPGGPEVSAGIAAYRISIVPCIPPCPGPHTWVQAKLKLEPLIVSGTSTSTK